MAAEWKDMGTRSLRRRRFVVREVHIALPVISWADKAATEGRKCASGPGRAAKAVGNISRKSIDIILLHTCKHAVLQSTETDG